MDTSDLRRRSARELHDLAVAQGLDPIPSGRAELVIALLQAAARKGGELLGDGVLEIMPEGFGFLRAPHLSYAAGADDVYVSPSQIRRFELRPGDTVGGVVRPPKEGERYVALLKVGSVNGQPPDARRAERDFADRPVVPPSRWLTLPATPATTPLLRAIDLLAPLPAGGRALVLGPAGSGRTSLLVQLAGALAAAHADLAVHLLLIDQPPEDLAELTAPPGVELVATAADEGAERHVQVAELALARAARLTETGKPVVLLLDSATRLCRALHAAEVRHAGAIEPAALHRLRRWFAAGRVLETGGSLTIVVSARTGGAPIDDAALEGLIPAASSIVRLDPAHGAGGLPLDVRATAARRTDRYLTSDHHGALLRLRAELAGSPPLDASRRIEALVEEHPDRPTDELLRG
jgi:transcription termination factor Rho